MKPIAFDPSQDIEPIPFEQTHLNIAKEMKKKGLAWQPHVGCFVWDHKGCISTPSPFPLQIYFILSLPRFIDLFGSKENVAAKLVWLPTWHQARILAVSHNIDHKKFTYIWQSGKTVQVGQDLLHLYRLILEAL